MNAASKRARWARGLRARDSEYNSVNSSSTLDDSSQDLHHHPSDVSTKPQHKKGDAGSYKAFKEDRKHNNGKLTPEQTANGTDFTDIQVPEGAPTDLVCEECERRDAVGYCELCEEILCAVCLAIMHIPSTGGQAHMHFSQEGLRTLRAGDESAVMRIEDDPIPAHQIDEEEMATRRDLSVSSALDAPTIDFTSRTAPRNAATPLYAKGQLVVFKASLADSLPDRLAIDDDDAGDGDGDGDAVSAWQALQPRELYGEVMSVPMARHGRWGHAGRRAQGHRLLLRVKVLGRASRPYSEPFVEEWLRRQYRREVPREPVQISGGSGADPLAREIGLAKVKDRQREDIKRTMVPPENELPMSRPPGQPVHSAGMEKGGRDDGGVLANRGERPANSANRGENVGVDHAETTSCLVILIAEDELFAVEAKREELRKHRCSLLEACRKSAERRQAATGALVALGRWHSHIVEARRTRQLWASQVLQRRVRGTLVRLRLERQRKAEGKALWDAGRRLHKQFRYLDTEELRKAAGGGVTTNGQVFVGTKAELNRLEALRKVMAERSYRMLCKGVYHAKVRTFKHWLRHTEWVGRNNEAYVFSVAKDASLAGDELQEPASYETDWRHPSHGIEIPALPALYCERLKAKEKEKLSSAASASAVKRMAGPAPFCSWLIPGLVLISSYLDAEAKARPREFKQPPHRDAASQIVIAGVGTLICLTSQEVVRQYESDRDLPPFDQVFEVRHKVISADTKIRFAETKHEVTIMRQEEKKLQTQTVGGQDPEERRKELAEIVGRMRTARSAFDAAQQASDRFPKQLRVAWDPFPEDEALGVGDVVKFAVRLEDRLRAGEKLCLWTPRGHGRVGLVGAVLLGRLYGCTAEDAILRVQACHDTRESLKGRPQISCPQTIAQVQCVREVLLQMSSMYTDLTMRADLPASTRGVQVCRSVRGEGPPSLRQPICVPDETQSNRFKREKARRARMDATQDDCNSTLSTNSTNTNTTPGALSEDDSSGTLNGGGTELPGPVERTLDSEARPGKLSSRDRTTVSRGVYDGGVGAGGDVLLLPSLKGKGSGRHQPPRERARAVAAVPYPTMRSLRLT